MKLFYIFFYVPKESANSVKEAMFKAGAGKIGDYEMCSWECEGVGQFKPINSANPYIGELNKLQKVNELKVEMVCKEENLKDAINALKFSHPYEEVAYGIIELYNLH
jgi:hypothetical protein